jgi:hypothetical protein
MVRVRGLCFCVHHAFQVMKLVWFLINIYARLANSSVNLLLYRGFSTNALHCVCLFIYAKRDSWESFVRVYYHIIYKTDYS